MNVLIEFTVQGAVRSKANSRKLVTIKGKPAFVKSGPAQAFAEAFGWQCPKLYPLLGQDLMVEIDIWYDSRRPDLDESLILDGMQNKVYVNDRQVKQKLVTWHLDPAHPRCRVRVYEYVPVVNEAEEKTLKAARGAAQPAQ